jgi:phospholipase/carboxylesterase
MKLRKLGDLDAHVFGGTDREGGGAGPVLVLLHGFGAPGTDLVSLYRQIEAPAEVRFVFPMAPLVLDPSAPPALAPRAFWNIDILALQQAAMAGRFLELIDRVPEGLDTARAAVVSLLDAVDRELDAGGRIVLGGFSQGAMLACDVALRTTRPLAGLVPMSGSVIASSEWRSLAPARKGLRVLQSHGRQDPILPFAGGVALRDLLTEGGLEVEWHEFNGGHGIPDGVVRRLGPFLSRVVEGAS